MPLVKKKRKECRERNRLICQKNSRQTQRGKLKWLCFHLYFLPSLFSCKIQLRPNSLKRIRIVTAIKDCCVSNADTDLQRSCAMIIYIWEPFICLSMKPLKATSVCNDGASRKQVPLRVISTFNCTVNWHFNTFMIFPEYDSLWLEYLRNCLGQHFIHIGERGQPKLTQTEVVLLNGLEPEPGLIFLTQFLRAVCYQDMR